MIIIIGTFGQALAGQAHAVNIIAVIIVWRFIVRTILVMRLSHILTEFSNRRVLESGVITHLVLSLPLSSLRRESVVVS